MAKILTTGMIARELDCPLWKVQYLLNSRGIRAKGRVGHLRIFSPKILNVLRDELEHMGHGQKTV